MLIMLLDHFQSILELVLDLAEDVQLSLFCCRFVSVVFREMCLTIFLNKCNITAWNENDLRSCVTAAPLNAA